MRTAKHKHVEKSTMPLLGLSRCDFQSGIGLESEQSTVMGTENSPTIDVCEDMYGYNQVGQQKYLYRSTVK